MKKHISIAALLVAGTSLANAGTASFTFNSPIDGATNIPVNTGSTETITGSLDTVASGAKFELSQGGARWDSSSRILYESFFFISYNVDSHKWSNDVVLSEISSITGISVDALKTIEEGVGNCLSDTANPLVVTLSGLEANTEYAITTIWGPSRANWKFDVTQGSFVEGYCGDLWSNGSRGWESLGEFPSDLGSAYAVKTIVRTDDTGTISFKETGGRTEIGFLSVSAIPEPSAFGMLAGVGALALAVSRRRRK